MSWQPKYKGSGKLVNRVLTAEEKAAWEKHPATKNLYIYIEVQEPKKEIPQELKAYTKISSNDRKGHIGGSGEPH